MRMPNAHLATIDPAKVREYLLSDSHPVGQFKARFFRSFGFEPDRWMELEVALREHARTASIEGLMLKRRGSTPSRSSL